MFSIISHILDHIYLILCHTFYWEVILRKRNVAWYKQKCYLPSRDLTATLNISSKYLHNTALFPLVSLKTCRGNFTYLISGCFNRIPVWGDLFGNASLSCITTVYIRNSSSINIFFLINIFLVYLLIQYQLVIWPWMGYNMITSSKQERTG